MGFSARKSSGNLTFSRERVFNRDTRHCADWGPSPSPGLELGLRIVFPPDAHTRSHRENADRNRRSKERDYQLRCLMGYAPSFTPSPTSPETPRHTQQSFLLGEIRERGARAFACVC